MSSILTILMFVIVLATVGVLYTDGIWSNAIRLINVVTAALLATNFFEPVARWLDDWNASYTYLWDFLAIWALFVFFMVIFMQITAAVSNVAVRFIKVVDQVGGVVLSLWIGWIMVCFTMTTLHAAPLSKNFLFGGFQPQERMILGFAPDRQWLGFMQKESAGAFARSATPEEERQEKFVFDPHADFLPNYNARREAIEKNIAQKNTIVVGN
jgi:uncharacterized membrane protein required for colicin V production